MCKEKPVMCNNLVHIFICFYKDVLENEQIKLDWMFRYSIMQDIVRVSSQIFFALVA